MNDQLEWTLHAKCAGCAHELTAPLYMGVAVQCLHCGAPIHIDPAKTIFHRESGSGYWRG